MTECTSELNMLTPLMQKLGQIKLTNPNANINLETFEVVDIIPSPQNTIEKKKPGRKKKVQSEQLSGDTTISFD
jgi:hypothetical protein